MIDALRPQIEGSTAAHPCAWCLGGIALLLVCLLPGSAGGQGLEGDAALLGGTMKNLAFCPSNPELVAYSRQVEDTQELYLYDGSAGTVRQVTAVEESGTQDEDAEDFFEGGNERELDRFEGEFAWRPLRDRERRQWFAFVSSASKTGYGLFLSYLTPDGTLADRIVELPFEGQATAPAWSPNGLQLVFSGSPEGVEGNELFLHPRLRPFLRAEEGEASKTPAPVPLTESAGSLYPDWAPSGNHIAYQSKRTGEDGRTNWGISLLDLSTWEGPQSGERPRSVRLSGQLSAYHEYKPSWSPNGRYVAFYVSQSTVGASTGNRRQDIGVLRPVRGSEGGSGWTGRILEGHTGQRLAPDVLPNESRGPEWHTSDSRGTSLIYVRKEENKDNPIYLADVLRWRNDSANASRSLSAQFEEETRLHEEVTATRGAEGLRLAFASQEGERLRLQLRDGLGSTDGMVQADPSDGTKRCMVQFSARKKNDDFLRNYEEDINNNKDLPGVEIINLYEEEKKYRLVTENRFGTRDKAVKEKEKIERVSSFNKKVIEKCFYERKVKVW